MITPAYSPTATERVLPRMALDFTTASLDARVTVTRADNTATRINSSGYVEVVNANLPRFDYDPITLTCKGLLIEESRINVSAEVNNWTAYAASLTPDVTTSPAGTTTGDLFAESATTDTHLLYRAPTLSAVAYTFSVFYKIVGDRKLALYHTNTNTGRQFDATGVQSSGVFNAPSGGFAVTPMGNGWYRASITITAVAGANEFRFWIVRASDNALNYLGDGSSGAYLWGAQIEAGAFATSYIPTTTTSLTRNADVVSMTGTNFSDWYNASEGTFSGTAQIAQLTGTFPIWFSANDGTLDNFLSCYAFNPSSPNMVCISQVGAVQQYLGVPGPVTVNTKTNVSFAYKSSSLASAMNATGLQSAVSGTIPTVDRLTLGSSTSNFFLNGHLQKINYWPQRLTNNEVQAFSKVG
jgi:hypothetical protein